MNAVRKIVSKRWPWLLLGTGLAAVVAVNGIAWMQARAMTHFVRGGLRTKRPEKLGAIEKVKIILTGVQIPRPENRRSPQDVGLSYQTHTIAIPEGGSLETWLIPRLGRSRGVAVMFPAHAGSKDSLLGQAIVFHDLGYETVLVDFQGTGGSTGNDSTIGIREAREVALTVKYLEQMRSGRPIVLYGTSMGAAAVMRAIAVEGVTPGAIVLESPFDSLLNAVRHRFQAMGLPGFPAAELMVLWGGVQHGFNGFAHNPVEYAMEINCPTLIFQGERDPRISMAEVIAISDNLAGSKQLVSFAEAGHGSLLAFDAVRWKQELAQFLDQLDK